MNAKRFQRYARKSFAFLTEDFGFIEKSIPPTGSNEYRVRFETDQSRIEIEGINWGFNIDIRLSSLDSSEMKGFDSYCIWDLFEIRGVELSDYPEPESGGAAGKIQVEQMKVLAVAVVEHAKDILRGDHSVFPALAECIENRLAKKG